MFPGSDSGNLSSSVSSLSLGLVVLYFCRALSRWPFIVAIKLGGYFLSDLLDNPGMGGMKPLVRALFSVDIDGEKREAWANATRSLGFALGLALTALRAMFLLGSFMCQSPFVVEFLVPVRIT